MVYQAYQADEGGYHALVAVNWNNEETQTVEIDLINAGVTDSADYVCNFMNLWTGENVGSSISGKYTAENIVPHGHVALKVTCSPKTEQFISKILLTL